MKELIYLDNAATSFPKPKNTVLAVSDSLLRCGNPGRGGHIPSLYSARVVYECREAICSFFNFDYPQNVVFTYNTTYALNMAINSLAKENSEILVSNLEHNSVMRPVVALKKQNRIIDYSFFDVSGSDEQIIKSFEGAITNKTSLAVVTMCSNITGKILPYKDISRICESKGILLVFDAAQCAGLVPIDLKDLYFSAVCFAGHKSLYGIMGAGFCIFSHGIEPEPQIRGGNGVESLSLVQSGPLPERLESGTPGVPAIIGLREGIKHIHRVGLDYIGEKCTYLEKRLSSALLEMKNVKVYGDCSNKVSTVLFNVENISCEETAALLSSKGICVRAGFHCAPVAHKTIGTYDIGAVRASISHFNTVNDVDALINEVFYLSKSNF